MNPESVQTVMQNYEEQTFLSTKETVEYHYFNFNIDEEHIHRELCLNDTSLLKKLDRHRAMKFSNHRVSIKNHEAKLFQDMRNDFHFLRIYDHVLSFSI